MSAFSDAQIVRHLSRRPLTTGNTGSNARYAESSQEEADPGTGQNGKPFGVVAILLQTYAHVKHNRTVSRFGRYREAAVVHCMGSQRDILYLDYVMFSGGICMICGI